LIAAICTYIYVLDFGQQIFAGPTGDAMASELVRAAYLGSDSVQIDVGDADDEATAIHPQVVPHA
jgi:hypothetical protein